MARAQANQELLGTFGKIQHKTIDRGMTIKERKELKAGDARKAKPGVRDATPAGSGRASKDIRPHGNGAAVSGQRNAPPPGRTGSVKNKTPPVEEKKVKKAALATTGYQGTARPRPGAASKSPGAPARSVAESRPRAPPRHGGSRRYDDYDDELDDFIEYDDEPTDGYGGRRGGGYDSLGEDDSDMEAGLTDIDEEERRAEAAARLEDRKEQELEKKLKLEKEQRKRRTMGGR